MLVEASYNGKIDVIELKSPDELSKHLQEIIQLIKISYKEGYYGSLDVDHLKRSLSMAKIVFALDQTSIAACSIYRRVGASHKMSAIACDQTEYGKKALQEILKSDLEPFSNWVWMEVSGPIEHYAKKYGGYPLPNYLAAQQLNNQNISIDSLSTDGFHYKRKIGIDDEVSVFEKVIFGFKNQEIANQVTSDVNYANMRSSFNLREGEVGQLVKDAITAIEFIDLLDVCYDENRMRELTEEFACDLEKAINILEQKQDSVPYGKNYLELAQFFGAVMPILKTFSLKV